MSLHCFFTPSTCPPHCQFCVNGLPLVSYLLLSPEQIFTSSQTVLHPFPQQADWRTFPVTTGAAPSRISKIPGGQKQGFIFNNLIWPSYVTQVMALTLRLGALLGSRHALSVLLWNPALSSDVRHLYAWISLGRNRTFMWTELYLLVKNEWRKREGMTWPWKQCK